MPINRQKRDTKVSSRARQRKKEQFRSVTEGDTTTTRPLPAVAECGEYPTKPPPPRPLPPVFPSRNDRRTRQYDFPRYPSSKSRCATDEIKWITRTMSNRRGGSRYRKRQARRLRRLESREKSDEIVKFETVAQGLEEDRRGGRSKRRLRFS